jgi:polyisoprenoid-binding protein YceI
VETAAGIVNSYTFMTAREKYGWRLPLAILALLASGTGSPSVLAQERTARLDPAQTKIDFTLGDVLHTVHGTFRLKTGLIRFDSQAGTVAGNVVIDATSGESGNGTRDRKMHKEVLQSETYPEIAFTPSRWKGTLSAQGPSRIEVTGQFLMHGHQHEITFPLDVVVEGQQLKINSQVVLPYMDWGVKNPSTFILRVSDKVTIDIHAAARMENGDHPQ